MTGATTHPDGELRPLEHVGSLDPAWADLRTEDIRFSPAGDRLAVVATNGTILLFAIDAAARPLRISHTGSIVSPTLRLPHGIDFVSDDLLVVANRSAAITFHRIPPTRDWHAGMTIDACDRLESDLFGAAGATRLSQGRVIACGAGSVRVHGDELIVACNNRNTVSIHPCSASDGTLRWEPTRRLLGGMVEIPDGLAVSPDGQWVAVSDHDGRRVLVHCRATRTVSCVLRDPGLGHPHGLCFDRTGERLFVGDAGKRQIHVFASHDGWTRNQATSLAAVHAVTDAAFNRTLAATAEEYRSLEGGVKGLDIHPSGTVLATTCRNQTLRFFDIAPVTSGPAAADVAYPVVG